VYKRQNDLTLKGTPVSLDFGATSLGAVHLEAIWISEQGSSPAQLELFPGDYEIGLGDFPNGRGIARLFAGVSTSAKWEPAVKWAPHTAWGNITTTFTNLDTAWFDLDSAETILELKGHTAYLDLALDNDAVHLHGYEKDLTSSQSLALFPGNLDLEFGSGTGLAARTRSFFDGTTAALRDTTYWADADSSLAGVATVLDSGYLTWANDSIYLSGITGHIDFTASDNQIHVPGLASVETGYHNYRLFPGDYAVQISATSTQLALEADPTLDRLTDDILYKDPFDSSGTGTALHCNYYARSGDTLQLSGWGITLDQSWLPQDTLRFIQIDPSVAELAPGTVNSRSLLPSGYMIDQVPQNATSAEFRAFVRLANSGMGWQAPVYTTDLGAGGNPYQPDGPYPEQFYDLLGPALTFMELPDADDGYFPSSTPYATLRDHLDGSFYRAENNALYVKYEERYWDQSDLKIRIVDGEDAVTTVSNVSRTYGPNWLQLDLSGLGISTGEFYVLEVTDPKGRLSMLKFYYP